MRKPLVCGLLAVAALLCVAPAPARAEFKPFGAAATAMPPLNFCASGKLIVYTGSCSPAGKMKDVISAKACNDVTSVLLDGLPLLYPNAEVEHYSDLTAEEVMNSLMRPGVLGFFFVGEGDVKGAFITGPGRERVYPDASACLSYFDLFAGFTSHSKYSPAMSAPKSERALVLSRTQIIYGTAGAMPDSWPKLCKPMISLVYPTRTFSGRMKGDAKKFMDMLLDEKRRQVLKTLAAICDHCQEHLAANDDLARFCPPNSDACTVRDITAGSGQFILQNYCRAYGPVASPQ